MEIQSTRGKSRTDLVCLGEEEAKGEKTRGKALLAAGPSLPSPVQYQQIPSPAGVHLKMPQSITCLRFLKISNLVPPVLISVIHYQKSIHFMLIESLEEVLLHCL